MKISELSFRQMALAGAIHGPDLFFMLDNFPLVRTLQLLLRRH